MFGRRFEIPHTIDGRSVTVIMRPAQNGDAAKLARLFGDFAVQQFLYLRNGLSVKDEEETLERLRVAPDQVGWVIAVEEHDAAVSEEVVGISVLMRQRSNRYTSYFVLADRAYWGKGVAGLTHRLRTWYAFCELGAYALDSSYFDGNPASGKALKRVGYVRTGRKWRSHFTDGQWYDEILLSCYNPLMLGKLWPDGDIPKRVHRAVSKTEAAFTFARTLLELR